jgi:hypothetical protein
MQLDIHFLRSAEKIREILRQDGWNMTTNTASHPRVPDEVTARHRLEQLGLLTSPAVQIDFPPQQNRQRANIH